MPFSSARILVIEDDLELCPLHKHAGKPLSKRRKLVAMNLQMLSQGR
ncbi:hypothetical protein HBR94_05290 [Pseudomonas sp. WS 5412]|nr:hypothetical protein [Pseudomonas sp. WS 5412]NMY30916.1 hypothetical protein [Pseudomonas sp. WS 5412]